MPYRNRSLGLGCVALSLLPSAGVAWVACTTAAGVVQTGTTTVHTEFANPTWSLVAWLLVVPVWLSGRATPSRWLVCATLAAVPQWVLAVQVVQRYQQTGWSDGLEVFAYVEALAMTAAFAGAAWAGAHSRHRRPLG